MNTRKLIHTTEQSSFSSYFFAFLCIVALLVATLPTTCNCEEPNNEVREFRIVASLPFLDEAKANGPGMVVLQSKQWRAVNELISSPAFGNSKLLFITRHGQATSNVAEATYGSEAWNEVRKLGNAFSLLGLPTQLSFR